MNYIHNKTISIIENNLFHTPIDKINNQLNKNIRAREVKLNSLTSSTS